MIDIYNDGLQPLNSFVLPGGSPLSAALHVARTVVRRAERLVVELVLAEPAATRRPSFISTASATCCSFWPASPTATARTTFCGHPVVLVTISKPCVDLQDAR